MRVYSLGFMIDKQREEVVLILKRRPELLVGKLNGVGGTIESPETPIEGMIREFREETGILYKQWQLHSIYPLNVHARYQLFIFVAYVDRSTMPELQQLTDEYVAWYPILCDEENVPPIDGLAAEILLEMWQDFTDTP